MEENGSYHLISELFIPSFDSPKQSQLFAFENDRNFSTYRITFLNNQDDFNNSKQIELAEVELFGVPDSDQWLSTSPIFHLGGQANTRIISTAPGSWRFNGGEVNYQPVEPNTASLQTWTRNAFSDYNSSKFFLNGTEQIPTEVSYPEQYPLDTNPFASLGTGYTPFGGKVPFDGKIAEIIVVQDVSEENRFKFEGYLAHKWGLTAKLPVNHPYKNSFNPTYTPPTPIFKLFDQSGNQNDASQSNTQNRPGIISNAVNSKAVIQFDGDDFLTFKKSNQLHSLFIYGL